jgi:TonB family protein
MSFGLRAPTVLAISTLLVTPIYSAAQDKPRTLKPEVEAELDKIVIFNAGEPGGSAPTELQGNVLRVRRDGGSARTRRIVSDFTLTADVRLLSATSDLQIGIRTIHTDREWPRRGYWLRVSGAQPATLQAKAYELKKTENALIRTAPATWHTVAIKAVGPTIDVAVNGQAVGSYAIQTLAGSVLFQTESGDAEIRNINLQVVPQTGLIDASQPRARGEFDMPRLMRETKPAYSKKAMDAKIQGVIQLETVILPNGSTGAVGLRSLLDPDLEHCALEAIRNWLFVPARLNGSPVPVLVEVEMSFTLHK